MKHLSKKRLLRMAAVGLAAITALVLAIRIALPILYPFLFHPHEHCIKQAGFALLSYTSDHGGRYPYHTNGFGDAMLVALRADPVTDPRVFTAPSDDARLLKECLRTGADVPEERCTRVYVQGLSETNFSEIAILFDRYPTRGGDHFRRPWGPLVREVSLLHASMQIISEEKWPEFRQEQIGFLIDAGFSRADAEKLYAPPVR